MENKNNVKVERETFTTKDNKTYFSYSFLNYTLCFKFFFNSKPKVLKGSSSKFSEHDCFGFFFNHLKVNI